MSENQKSISTPDLSKNPETKEIPESKTKEKIVAVEGEKENVGDQPSSKDQNQLEGEPLAGSGVDKKHTIGSDAPILDKSKPRFVVRLRGLPWSVREKEIKEFFKDEHIVEIQIVFLRNGKASGEALVELETLSDFQSAFLKNRQHLGRRYVEIFKATDEDIDIAAGRITKSPIRPKSLYVVRMRGLPYEASENDIKKFFNTLNVKVYLVKDDLGRPSGEGFIELNTEEELTAAMAKHRHNMGRRYIELFRSNPEELVKFMGFTDPSNGGNRRKNVQTHQSRQFVRKDEYLFDDATTQANSNCLLMRGLPYSCTESDITKFFQEVHVTPVRIHRKTDGAEAYVEFFSPADCSKAITRNRSFIGPRYIELTRVSYAKMVQTVGLSLEAQQRNANAANSDIPQAYFQHRIPRNVGNSQNFGLVSNISQIEATQQLYGETQQRLHPMRTPTDNSTFIKQPEF